MNLTDKVALVTGGARRVGRAVALRLAEAGCHVMITFNTSADEAAQTVADITALGRRAWCAKIDLASPSAPRQIVRHLKRGADRLDVLVHNAAVYRPTPWGKLTREDWYEHIRVNATAPVMITQALADLLAADGGGRVIHFLDAHLLDHSRRNYLAYSVSKAALLEATHCLAREMAPHVTVNAIAPGVVDWAEDMTAKQRKAYLQQIPLGRAGTVDDAAGAVLFLARDADYLTGQIIRLDGGRTLT